MEQTQRPLQPERRKAQSPYVGDDRRKQYSPDEMPPDPTPGDPGVDARNQQWLEQQRAVEREQSDKGTEPGPTGT
jgi:hypothetical protein